jgi:hypothetical protein
MGLIYAELDKPYNPARRHMIIKLLEQYCLSQVVVQKYFWFLVEK